LTRAAVLAAALVVLLLAMAPALARGAVASPAEVQLAERHAPVVKIPARSGCEDGKPYEPVDVDVLFGNDEVALRGPWDRTNVVKVAPSADDIGRPLYGYHLDFPGDTLDPGCFFEEWQARLEGRRPATAYARLVAEPGRPGRIALQYWFFYIFNDWNNNHEGDWEMIQLVFPADSAEEALATEPVEAVYSQHSSAERADWASDRVEKVDGTHPVVYPAQGSHANFFSSDLYLMSSQAEGVGCDDTRDYDRAIRPRVATVPTARADYVRAYPWLAFEGRWGEQQAAFFNGPTGPNDKLQWTRPITWIERDARDQSFTVPGDGPFAPTATGVFCDVVFVGSEVLRRAKASPALAVVVLGGLVLLLLWSLGRTRWSPASPREVRRRRRWGQLITASWRMYRGHPRVFLGIGLVFIPIGALVTGLQYLLFRLSTFAPLVEEAGEQNAFVAGLALALGVVTSVLGYVIVQAVVARAVGDIDAGHPVTWIGEWRAVAPRLLPLVRTLAIIVLVLAVLNLSLVLVPVAFFLLVRWGLVGVLLGADPGRPPHLLRRSWALTGGHFWRTASISVGVTGLALATGPLVGTAFLLFSSASFGLINLISAVVYVAALPFPAIVMTYLAGDLAVRQAARAERRARDEAPGASAPGAA
jgi:hypothetical protein